MSGSSSSSAPMNPPTPSLSSLASFTPPSSEFIYVNGNMTTPPRTVSSLDNMRVSLTSSSQHVSLEEALMRVSDLMRENGDLKDVLQQNNVTMKEQCRVLAAMKHQWTAEREEMKHRFDQTRTVIMGLRRNVENKDAKLMDLEGQMANRSDEFIVTKEESPSLSAQMNSLRQQREEAEKQAELQSAQNKFLQKQTEKLNDKIAELIEAKSNVDSERVRLREDNEKQGRECGELKKLTVKQQETQERLIREKQQLLTSSDSLQEQINDLNERLEDQRTWNQDAEGSSRESNGDEATSGEMPQQTRDADGVAASELQEEKRKITRLQARLSKQNTMVQTLRQELHEKDLLLAASSEELQKTTERLTKTHQHQIDDLKAQLKLHPNYNEDVMVLRAQVTSLVGELQNSEQRLKDTNDDIERYKHSCTELQGRLMVQEAEVSRQRIREDQLTEDLRAKISSIESALLQEKKEKDSKEVSLQKLRLNFDQLCSDYHELLSKQGDYKQEAGTSIHQREFQEEVDNLTAQIITAEEALVLKEAEIEDLREQLRRLQEEIIPVLKAQAEVYIGDFNAERKAREKAHGEYERIREELEDVYKRNYTLEQQLHTLSVESTRDVMSRHIIEEDDSHGADLTGGDFDRRGSHGELVKEPKSTPPTPAEETLLMDLKCPMCKELCPDYDSLVIHAARCVDKEAEQD